MSNNISPVSMLVPYVQGGGSDQRARLTAKYLALEIGRPVEVINCPGAVSGHQAIADAAPDGNTIGLITGEIGMMHWHDGLTELTPADYTPLAVPFVESSAVIVRADAPYADLSQFLEHCRHNTVVGSGGPDFSVWKFSLAGLFRAAGVPLAHLEWIETFSGEQGLDNVMEGHAVVAPITMTDARDPLKSGAAKALATMEDVRHAAFPDIPTVFEAVGIPWGVAHWRGIVAPKGLPPAIAEGYVTALKAVAQNPGFNAEAQANAFTLRWRFGKEFSDYMQEDDKQFGEIIKAIGASTGRSTKLD